MGIKKLTVTNSTRDGLGALIPSGLLYAIRYLRISDLPFAIYHTRFFPACYVLFAVFLSLAAGCSTFSSTTPETVLAHVNGDPLTVQSVETAFNASHQGHSAFLAGQGVVREVLNKVIDKQLLLQEARRIGLDHEAEIEHVVEQRRADLATQEFFKEKISSQVTVAEEAIAEAHKRMSVRFQARHILVGSREAAQSAYDRIQAGEDFGQVAIEVSQADTKAKGGYLGIVTWGRLDPDIEEKLMSLELGELSKPFATREGWNLLFITEKRPGPTTPLNAARAHIRQVLANRDRTRRLELLLRDLEARWKPKFNERALQGIVQARNKEEISPESVLVDFGDEKILASQVMPKIDFTKLQKLADPIALRAMRTVMEEDVLGILVKKEALAQGYGQRPHIVKEVEQLRDTLAVDHLLGRVAFANLDVTEQEARAYWEAHEARFTEPAAVKFSMIVTDTENRAQEILKDLKAGADFAVTARKVSTHAPTANLGGEMGWANKGSLEPELESLAFSLKKGEFGIAQVKNSYLLIRIDDTRPQRVKPLSEVEEQAKRLVLQEKKRDTMKTWLTKLRQVSVIELDDEAIRRATTDYMEKVREKAEQKHG